MTDQTTSLEVLLIDDDFIDREYFCRMLKKAEGVEVTTAETLHAGIKLIRERSFSVVVFDLGLPDSYGIDTIKRMTEEFPSVSMIVLSGAMDVAVAEAASDLGLHEYLVKGEATAARVIECVRNAAE